MPFSYDPDAIQKCCNIIKTMQSHPLSKRKTVLPGSNRPHIAKKPVKVKPKKQEVNKKAKPTQKASTQIKGFLNPSELLASIRRGTFYPMPKVIASYTLSNITKYQA